MISSAEKAKLLENFDALVKAVKLARQVANEVEISSEKIGDSLMKAVIGDWLSRERMNPTQLM